MIFSIPESLVSTGFRTSSRRFEADEWRRATRGEALGETTAEQRSEAARKAATARWAKRAKPSK